MAFYFTPGRTADAKALGKMIAKLPPEASIYGDSAYTDYALEDVVLERKCILLKIQRKSNAKRIDALKQKNEKKDRNNYKRHQKNISKNHTCCYFGRFLNKTDSVCACASIKQINLS